MCNKIIHDDEIEALQVNLIRSHAAGLGDPLKPYIASAVLVVRLNTLAKGYSGVRIELLELMRDMINARIAPYIPSPAAWAPPATSCTWRTWRSRSSARERLPRGRAGPGRHGARAGGPAALRLSFKEGIALMNGTSP